MSLLSNKIQREQLNPGDHIYTWRCGYSYSHHGIYVDDGKVIHLTRAPGLFIFSSSHDESSSSHPSGADRVVCCSIEEFVSGGDLYLYEYGVNRALFLIKRGGTCTPITSDPPKDVLHRASVLLEKGFGHYNLFENNCEDFAIYCKTGLLRVGQSKIPGSSGQIQFLFYLFVVVSLTPSRFLPSGLALVVSGLLFCGFRLRANIDIVEKVAVEKFHDLSNQRTTIRMENGSTRIPLSASSYILYSIFIFNYWSWTPTSRILLWVRFIFLYQGFHGIVAAHLRNYPMNLKLGEYVGCIIWALGYWYWRSEGRIYFWTKLICLKNFLFLFVSDHLQRSKLEDYIHNSIFVLNFWSWTPTCTILLWLRFICFYHSLYSFVSDHLRNHPMNLILGEYVGWIIWAHGYWYWRSESRIFFWTKLICLKDFLCLTITNITQLLIQIIRLMGFFRQITSFRY